MNTMKRTNNLERSILSILFLLFSSLTVCWGQLTRDMGTYSGAGMSNSTSVAIEELNSVQQRINLYFTLAGKRSIGLSLYGQKIDVCTQTLYGIIDGEEVEYPTIPIRELTSPDNLCPVSYLPAGRYVLKVKVDTSQLLLSVASPPLQGAFLTMFLYSKPLEEADIVDVPLYLPCDSEPAYGDDPTVGITSSRSYILTRQMLSDIGTSCQEQVEYFDGLGRPVQTVLKGATPNGCDLDDFTDYDSRGNVWRRWKSIPVVGFSGAFINNLPLKASMVCGDTRPYSEAVYANYQQEAPTRSVGLGESWKGHASHSFRKINSKETPFDCAYLTVSSNGLPVREGNWADGELSVIHQTDEDDNERLIFIDKLGRIILERALCDSIKHDTYYVYDLRGDLRCVLPPSLDADSITSEQFLQFGYAYTYDGLHRLTKKRLPGCGWQSFSYDDADRKIFSRDARQAALGEYSFSIPDSRGREVVSGICSGASSFPFSSGVVKASFELTGNSVAGTGYTFLGISIMPSSLLNVNYYDTYDFLLLPSLAVCADSLAYRMVSGYTEQYTNPSAPATSAFGRLTGNRTYLLDTGEEILTAYYYDDCGNVVQSRSTNHLGGYDSDFFAYTFSGKLKKHYHIHTVPDKLSQTELYTYEYDHSDRLVSVSHSANGCPPVYLMQHSYDEFCRLHSTSFHNGADSLLYAYNVRDWLTGIDSGKFSENLYYATGPGTPCYNGNISSVAWHSGTDAATRGYQFTYDELNRLMNAEYGEGGSLLQNSGRFNEQVTGYDRVGNILGLKRYGQTTSTGYGLVDNLSLTYNGNQLKKVTDTATGSVYGNGFEFKNGANKDIEYEYDENGNLTKDLNKNILDIQYNCLNLPSRIEFANGNTISYVYDASGMKLRTVHLINGVTTTADYCGNVVYENGVAKALLTETGYITLSDNKYHYYLKDHQGNNRVVISQDGTTEEVNHYYPFGGLMSNSFANNVQPYKYNGKELDRKSDLDWYDYGARMYDAALGRWHIVDPRAEKYSALSPYVYCDNNPIRNLDLKGDSITVLNLGAGTNQHMAILIQNDAGKWQYFSVNGDNVYSSGSHTGGRKFDDIAVGEWDSPQLFMDSQYNSEGGKSDENSNSYGYSEGYIIPTTPEQDGIIREKFVNISRNESYDLLVNNCATAVQKSLESGGVKAYYHKRKNAQIRMIRSTSAFNLGAPKGERSIIPSTAFQSIIIHNPKGKLIHKRQ